MTSAATLHSTGLRGGLGARPTAIAIGNEIHKGLLQAWSERLQILIELPLFVVSLLLFALLGGRAQEIASGQVEWQLDPSHVSPLFIGYAGFLFLYLQSRST